MSVMESLARVEAAYAENNIPVDKYTRALLVQKTAEFLDALAAHWERRAQQGRDNPPKFEKEPRHDPKRIPLPFTTIRETLTSIKKLSGMGFGTGGGYRVIKKDHNES